MKFRVLGSSGGIGRPATTTSFLIDDDILVDAGTGVGTLTLEELAGINHVFLTHSHLDHICSLMLMSDSVGMMRDRPLQVYARGETLDALREHVMNGFVWPDFTVIPTPDNPFLVLKEMTPGSEIELRGRKLRSIEVNHTIPAVGYLVGGDAAWLALSGDTGEMTGFWDVINATDNLRFLIIETTFPDEQAELARVSGHLCPALLGKELQKLSLSPEIYITHLMPGSERRIMDQIANHAGDRSPKQLVFNQVFEL